MSAQTLQSCLTLCDPVDCSLPGSSSSPGMSTGVGCPALLQSGLSNPGIETASLRSPALAHGFFTTSATWEALPTFGLWPKGLPWGRGGVDARELVSKWAFASGALALPLGAPLWA